MRFGSVFLLKKMTIQNLELGIFHAARRNDFRCFRYYENGHDGEKDRQAVLMTSVVI